LERQTKVRRSEKASHHRVSLTSSSRFSRLPVLRANSEFGCVWAVFCWDAIGEGAAKSGLKCRRPNIIASSPMGRRAGQAILGMAPSMPFPASSSRLPYLSIPSREWERGRGGEATTWATASSEGQMPPHFGAFAPLKFNLYFQPAADLLNSFFT
jgi:hypothetical protein